ncbi:MAG: protein TolR [Holosporales bacterium]|jgi:biopolymer transport protein TolR
MAMTSLSRKRRRGSIRHADADINITPFVDVVLVLLVIFMVAAPLMTVGVDVELPQTSAAPIKNDEEPLVLSLNSKGEIFIGENLIPREKLLEKLQAVTAAKEDSVIYIRADKRLSYGQVMELMGAINNAGYSKVALVTDALDEPR